MSLLRLNNLRCFWLVAFGFGGASFLALWFSSLERLKVKAELTGLTAESGVVFNNDEVLLEFIRSFFQLAMDSTTGFLGVEVRGALMKRRRLKVDEHEASKEAIEREKLTCHPNEVDFSHHRPHNLDPSSEGCPTQSPGGLECHNFQLCC